MHIHMINLDILVIVLIIFALVAFVLIILVSGTVARMYK